MSNQVVVYQEEAPSDGCGWAGIWVSTYMVE